MGGMGRLYLSHVLMYIVGKKFLRLHEILFDKSQIYGYNSTEMAKLNEYIAIFDVSLVYN